MAYRKPPFDTTRYYIPPQNPDAYGLDVNYVTPSYTSNIPREDFDTFNQYHYDYLQNPITLPIPDDEVIPDYQVLEDESLNKFRDVTPDQTTDGNGSKFNFGKFNWRGVGDLASTATGHIMDVLNNSKSTISIPKYTNYHTTSLNSLDDVYGMQNAQYLDKSILHKPTANDFGFDWIQKAAEGAAAGSSFGPWGALAGAIGGAGAAVANAFVKKNTYKNDLSAITNFNRIEKGLRNYAYNQGLNNTIKNRDLSMNIQRSLNSHAVGGPLGSEEQAGVTTFNTGGTHEMNPNGGIPQGIGDNGQPNVVEQGEVKWNNFIFSNRIQPNGDILSKYNTAFNKRFNSYADAANFILDLHKERENNPFDKSTLNVQMQRLADAQEYQKLSDEAAQYGLTPEEYIEYQQQILQSSNQYAEGGPLGKSWFTKIFQARKNAASAYDSQGNLVKPLTTDVYRGTENKRTDDYRKQVPSEVWDAALKFIESYYSLYNYVWEYNEDGRLNKNEQDRYDSITERINSSAKILSKYISFCAAYDRVNGTKTMNHFLQAFYDKGHFNGQGAFNGGNIYKLLVNEETIQSALPALNSARQDRYKLAKDTFGQTKSFTAITPYQPTMVATTLTTTNAAQPTTQTNTDTATQTTSVPQTNQTTGKTTNATTRSSNNSNGVSYYNADSQRYIPSTEYNSDPNKYPNVYTITNRNGLNGKIDYNTNPNYTNKVNSLTDEDWEQIKNRLQERNPNFYGKHDDLQYYKDKAIDGEFGPIHREIIAYQPTVVTPDVNNDSTPAAIIEEIMNNDTAVPATTNTSTQTNLTTPTTPTNDNFFTKHPWYYAALRAAPIFNNLHAILTQNNPDYTYANQIASTYRPISNYPVGQYQRYQPIDQHYLDTQANQRANTQYGFYRDNTQSASAANAYATLAAANQSAAVNDAYIRALQTNNQNRNAALQYNNQLDRANEQARNATQATNYANYANIMGNAYAAAEQERLAVENARETNMQNLAMNLGDLGRELYDRWRIAKDPTNAYDADFNYQGRIPYFWNPTKKQFEPAE